MGSLFGARLAMAGNDVALVDVDRSHVGAINKNGLEFDDGSGSRRIPIMATTDPASIGKVNLIVLFCKYPHTRAAVTGARPMIGPNTYVWTLQNGIGNVDVIAETIARERIVKGLTSVTAIATGPGRVITNFRGESETFAWPLDNQQHALIAEATKLFTAAGLPAYLAPDIDYRIWRKLVVNAGLTVLSAVVNVGIGPVGEPEPGRRLLRAIVTEVVAVARANNVQLELDDAMNYMEELRHKAFEHVGSTTVDMQAKRPTEIDSMSGAVAREGKRLGIPTPTNEVIADIVRLLEATRLSRLPKPI